MKYPLKPYVDTVTLNNRVIELLRELAEPEGNITLRPELFEYFDWFIAESETKGPKKTSVKGIPLLGLLNYHLSENLPGWNLETCVANDKDDSKDSGGFNSKVRIYVPGTSVYVIRGQPPTPAKYDKSVWMGPIPHPKRYEWRDLGTITINHSEETTRSTDKGLEKVPKRYSFTINFKIPRPFWYNGRKIAKSNEEIKFFVSIQVWERYLQLIRGDKIYKKNRSMYLMSIKERDL